MLPKNKRLNLKKSFKWVVAGQRLGNNYLNLYFRSGENTVPLVGIATSKSDFRKATERNRARRLVSTGFEALYDKLPGGVNMVAMPRRDVLELTSAQVSGVLEELLQKGKVLQSEDNSIKTA